MRKRPSQTKSNQRYSEEALLVHLQAKSGYRREFFREKKSDLRWYFFLTVYLEKSCISYVNLAESQLSMRCNGMARIKRTTTTMKNAHIVRMRTEKQNDAPKRK